MLGYNTAILGRNTGVVSMLGFTIFIVFLCVLIFVLIRYFSKSQLGSEMPSRVPQQRGTVEDAAPTLLPIASSQPATPESLPVASPQPVAPTSLPVDLPRPAAPKPLPVSSTQPASPI